jgi:hypothetical protein
MNILGTMLVSCTPPDLQGETIYRTVCSMSVLRGSYVQVGLCSMFRLTPPRVDKAGTMGWFIIELS